jgi:hypothetical protein
MIATDYSLTGSNENLPDSAEVNQTNSPEEYISEE